MEQFKTRAISVLLHGSDEALNGLGWALGGLKNSREDYRSMFHHVDGKAVCHDDVHNLYGYNMTRAAGEAFTRIGRRSVF